MDEQAIQRNEIKSFWHHVGRLRAAKRDGGSAEDIAECVDELTAIEKHSDSTTLRARCRAVLAETNPAAVVNG